MNSEGWILKDFTLFIKSTELALRFKFLFLVGTQEERCTRQVMTVNY